ncbi:hypothetical protein ACIQRS_29820 [Streptomyces termitum]|uniref:Uncharacterized protein n=1 Tax=Streptomyces termitum TaxID=67368 RepID=A0A918T9D0_9ACTN|nr:hypothetical protein [Streptomyces termitum]GHB08018.1 hypothetical protein GCM10010305_58810 [Streptomyces termitum]
MPLPPSRPPSRPSSVLAALLDRSVARMAEAAADARWYDREAIRAAADIWDNNLRPLFWAASTSDAAERERRATAVLEWMGGYSDRRRAWMTEQAALAGHDVGPFLPPFRDLPGRDHQGHVMAPHHRFEPSSTAGLALDYDLETASVRHFQVERAGPLLTGYLQLRADRRFPVEDDGEPALLNVWLDGVTEAVFTLADARGGVALEPGADGVAVLLGPGGRIRAARGEHRLDDRSWHLSDAGRRADAARPPRVPRPLPRPPGEAPGPGADTAAALLRFAMLELRSVRYAEQADRVPVSDLCRAFAGAGGEVLAAGARDDSRREAAFLDLIRAWAERGGPRLARWFASALGDRRDLLGELPERERPVPSLADAPPPPAAPTRAVLLLAAWTAAHTRHGKEHRALARLQLALPPRSDAPPSGPWRISTGDGTAPEVFRLRTAAFDGPGPLVRTRTGTARAFDLHGGALHVGAEGGWSAAAD